MRTIALMLLTSLLLASGCSSKPAGSREFVPGEGWVPASIPHTTTTATPA